MRPDITPQLLSSSWTRVQIPFPFKPNKAYEEEVVANIYVEYRYDLIYGIFEMYELELDYPDGEEESFNRNITRKAWGELEDYERNTIQAIDMMEDTISHSGLEITFGIVAKILEAVVE